MCIIYWFVQFVKWMFFRQGTTHSWINLNPSNSYPKFIQHASSWLVYQTFLCCNLHLVRTFPHACKQLKKGRIADIHFRGHLSEASMKWTHHQLENPCAILISQINYWWTKFIFPLQQPTTGTTKFLNNSQRILFCPTLLFFSRNYSSNFFKTQFSSTITSAWAEMILNWEYFYRW